MRITLPEQVSLEFRPAGYGSRSLAYMFDFLIRWSLLLLIPTLIIILVMWLNGELLIEQIENAIGILSSTQRTSTRDICFAVVALVTFVVEWGYPMYFEVLRGGVTPGKRALGLRVVDENGLPITFRASFLRTTFLMVDLTLCLSFVGLISMAITKKRQRVGDIIAGTLVVYDAEQTSMLQIRDAESTSASVSATVFLPVNVYSALQTFISRKQELFPEVREDLAIELTQSLEKLGTVSNSGLENEEFLENVYQQARPRSDFPA